MKISFRLAAIKQLLCVHSEAIKEYKLILEMQHDYVPALKGKVSIWFNCVNLKTSNSVKPEWNWHPGRPPVVFTA